MSGREDALREIEEQERKLAELKARVLAQQPLVPTQVLPARTAAPRTEVDVTPAPAVTAEERLRTDLDATRRALAEAQGKVLELGNVVHNLEEQQLVRGLDLIEGLLRVLASHAPNVATAEDRELVERAQRTVAHIRRPRG